MGFLNGEQDNKCVADANATLINQTGNCKHAALSHAFSDFMNELSEMFCPAMEAKVHNSDL